MIDKMILDEILPVPELEELKKEKMQQLKDEGFVVTNWNPGGIFNTLLMIILQIRIEIITLLRSVLNRMFVAHADGTWLDLKAADYSKTRKAAMKTQGYLTLSRTPNPETGNPAVTIPAGTVFKTPMDINGEELRYYSTADAVLRRGAESTLVPIEAEKAGSSYNVPEAQISKCLVYLEGIEKITNEEGWITKEGSDTETDDALRSRVLGSWSELSTRPIAEKYKNVCEAVPGVLYVRVDDMHPRGQGTVDIVVTSTAGAASELLLSEVRAAAETIRGSYDDLLVKSSETVTQDISLTITIPLLADEDNLEDKAKAVIIDYFKISTARELNKLTHFDLMYALKSSLSIIKNVKITVPEDDVTLDNDKVLLLGSITITIERG